MHLELMALCYGLQQSNPFLGPHADITAYTDNVSVTYINTMKAQRGMVLRLILKIQEYPNLKIQHIPGRFNKLADYLSRVDPITQQNDNHTQTFSELPTPELEETVIPMQSSANITQPYENNNTALNTGSSQVLLTWIPNRPQSAAASFNTNTAQAAARAAATAAINIDKDKQVKSTLNPSAPIFNPIQNDQVKFATHYSTIIPATNTRSETIPISQSDMSTDETLALLYPPDTDDMNFVHAIQSLPTVEEIRNSQHEDAHLKPLIQYLHSSELPDNDTEARKLVMKSTQFMLDENQLLLHLYTNRRKKSTSLEKFVVQIVIPEIYIPRVLKAFHDDVIHSSKNKLYLQIRRNYFWDNLYQSCDTYTKNCRECQLSKPTNVQTHVPSKPLEISTIPWSDVTIDFVGPLTLTQDGYRYILTIQCNATRYLLMYPTRSQDAKTVCEILFQVMTTFGFFTTLRSDRGTSFLADMTQTLFKSFGIKHIISTSYSPHSQSRLERIHRSIGAALRCYPDANTHWPKFLPAIAYGINSTVREDLGGYSPAELLFARKFVPPALVTHQNSQNISTNIQRYMQELQAKQASLLESAKEAQIEAQLKNKERSDNRRPFSHFEVGDQVLFFKPNVPQNCSPKLTRRFNDVYTIRHVDNRYQTASLETSTGYRLPTRVHLGKLKQFYSHPATNASSSSSPSDTGSATTSTAMPNIQQPSSAQTTNDNLAREPTRPPDHQSQTTNDNLARATTANDNQQNMQTSLNHPTSNLRRSPRLQHQNYHVTFSNDRGPQRVNKS